MRNAVAKVAINSVGALIFLTLAVTPVRAQKIGDWCVFDRQRQLPFGANISQQNDGRSPIEHTAALFEDMANIGPGWTINQCFSSQGAALALLATFAAGDVPTTWCVMSCPTRPDAAGRPTPKRFTAILCKDIPWAPTMVSDGWTQTAENLTFTAAMAIVSTGDPNFPPGTPPGSCVGSLSFAFGGSGGGSGQSGGGGGGGAQGGGSGGGQAGGGSGLPPVIVMIPGSSNNDPPNEPSTKQASTDPHTPMPGPASPPPMGQPPTAQPPQNNPGTTTQPGTGPAPGQPPGFQSHFQSEPFTPGGQCPTIGAGQYAEKTGFESCKWDDPKRPSGHNGWVGCVSERNANFVCKASNAPPNCKCTQDWSGKVPPLDQLVALAPGPDRAPWQLAMNMDVMEAPLGDNPMAGLGPPPDPPKDSPPMAGLGPPPDPPKDSPPMGGLGPPPNPPANNPPAPGGTTTALLPPQGPPIYIPVPGPGAPPNVCHPKPQSVPGNVCHPKPGNVCHPTPQSSGTNSGTGTKIVDKWDTPKPPSGGSTGVISGGSCDTKDGVTTCTDLQGRKCTSKTGSCDPASQQMSGTPPPPSGPLSLKQKPGTQVANVCNPKIQMSSVPACESKPPYLPWGGHGSATITVLGGKPCGIGWHDTGATILDSMSVASSPSHGSLKPKDQHMIIFTPAPGYKGQDSFTLSMREHNSGRRATLTVKVSVTIR